eukprot:COSAG06_NODE_6484_length_2914_cov_41.869272_1_plen_187_part_00
MELAIKPAGALGCRAVSREGAPGGTYTSAPSSQSALSTWSVAPSARPGMAHSTAPPPHWMRHQARVTAPAPSAPRSACAGSDWVDPHRPSCCSGDGNGESHGVAVAPVRQPADHDRAHRPRPAGACARPPHPPPHSVRDACDDGAKFRVRPLLISLHLAATAADVQRVAADRRLQARQADLSLCAS